MKNGRVVWWAHTEKGTKNIGMWVISVLSILYIAAILFFRGNDAWMLFRAGELNELGDFLAGLCTPVAFGWLVYGYLLQSKELRLQREELALTRDQLGKQTKLLQEQVTADYHYSIPCLTISRIDGSDSRWVVKNRGGAAKNIELLNLNEGETVDKRNFLARTEHFQFGNTRGSTQSYEARFSSESSENFRQCWEIREEKCKEITNGPQSLATEK